MPVQEVSGPSSPQAKQLSSTAWGSARTPPKTHSREHECGDSGWERDQLAEYQIVENSDAIRVFAGWRSFTQQGAA